MRNSLRPFAVLATFATCTVTAPSATLVDFNFAGQPGNENNFAPASTAVGLTMAVNLTRGSGLGSGTSGSWETDGFAARNGGTSAATLTNAITRNTYARFSFTVNSGYVVSLSALNFGWSRQNNQTRNFTVMASLDGGATGFTVADGIDTETVANGATGTATLHTLDLSGAARLQDIAAGTTVEIRIYHYGTSNQYEGNALSSKSGQPGLDLIGTASVALGEAPVCAITAPAHNTLYPYGAYPASIPITVSTVDDVGVTEVRFYAGQQLLGTEVSAPFTFNWSWAPQQGSNYYLVAHAYDGSGNVGTSQTVRVEAGLDHPPTVSITAPTAGDSYAQGSYPVSIQITANAADDSGVAHVTFYANGGVIGTDTTPPYVLDWNWPAVEGLYVLTAVAEDDAATTTESSPVLIEALGKLPSGLLAYDDFTRASPGALHGVASGLGWSAPWGVQADDRSIPGYNVATNVPLTYGTLVTSANYAVGGKQYLGCKRRLNVAANGPFAAYLVAGDIGAPGTDLWAAYLYRRDAVAAEPCSLSFGRDADNNNPAVTRSCWTSNVGGQWVVAHLTNGVVVATASSGKNCVTNETALLALHFEFGTGGSSSSHVVSLYVNPPVDGLGAAPPATPDAVLMIEGDGNFRFDGIDFYPGAPTGAGSLDELRIGTSYAAVTPTTIQRTTLLLVR